MAITASVGNCAVNQAGDVITIKNLVFQIRKGMAGSLTDGERSKIGPTGVCEPELIQRLARAQKASHQEAGSAAACNEALSGGRVMPGSGTLKPLERNANTSAGLLEVHGLGESLMSGAGAVTGSLNGFTWHPKTIEEVNPRRGAVSPRRVVPLTRAQAMMAAPRR